MKISIISYIKVFLKISFIGSLIFFNFNFLPVNSNNKENSGFKQTINKDFYILGPGDEITLNFYGNPEYSGQYKIINDGTISLPFVGNVYISGKTIADATNFIENKLSREFISPNIYLSILKTRPINVSVIGEVNEPGYYSLSESLKNFDSTNTSNLTTGLPTLVDALKKAGGITKSSDIEEIEVIRNLPDNNQFSKKRSTINLMDLLLKGDHSQNLVLFDGDIVKVKKTETAGIKQFKISRANLLSVNAPPQIADKSNNNIQFIVYEVILSYPFLY